MLRPSLVFTVKNNKIIMVKNVFNEVVNNPAYLLVMLYENEDGSKQLIHGDVAYASEALAMQESGPFVEAVVKRFKLTHFSADGHQVGTVPIDVSRLSVRKDE